MKLLTLILISLLFLFTYSAIHPAKRQSFQALCGTGGVDCGNGWCCSSGQQCIPASGSNEPECLDTFLTDLGAEPLTLPAFPFSSLASLNSILSSQLNDWSLTQSTFPTTLPTTGTRTALPTYSDNTLKSYKMPSVPSSLLSPASVTATATSTGAARRMEWNGGLGVGVVGVGIGMGVVLGM